MHTLEEDLTEKQARAHTGSSQRMQPDVNTLLKGVRSPRQIGHGYRVTRHPSGSSAVGPPRGGTVAPSTLATCTSARASNPADGQLQDALSAPGEMPTDARSLCVRVRGEGPRSRSACRNRQPPVPLDSSSPRPPPGTHNGLSTGDFACVSTDPQTGFGVKRRSPKRKCQPDTLDSFLKTQNRAPGCSWRPVKGTVRCPMRNKRVSGNDSGTLWGRGQNPKLLGADCGVRRPRHVGTGAQRSGLQRERSLIFPPWAGLQRLSSGWMEAVPRPWLGFCAQTGAGAAPPRSDLAKP